jgi:glycosyltransferase involved in cell wall biosynthesis
MHWPGALRMHAVPMHCLPLPFAARRHPPRARSIGSGAPARLVMMGYLARNRRIAEVLAALAAFSRLDQVRLDIYGPVDFIDATKLIDEHGLGRHVTLHGLTSPDRLDSVLRDADIVVNLRGPTMGEVSGTQLRAWDHALPTLVSRVGWYATIPPEAAAFVGAMDPRAEREDLHRHLAAFLDDPAPYIAMGQAGRRLLEERHGMGPYVSGLLDLARSATKLGPAWAANHLADRVGALTRGWAQDEALAAAMAERIVDLLGP